LSNKKVLKNRVFGISKELDDLLKLYSRRMEISLSKFIRTSIEEKIEKLKQEEQKFWVDIPEKKMNDILASLTDYLCSKIAIEEISNCSHGAIFANNFDENFIHTKEFCAGLQIEFESFLNKIKADFKLGFDCECELLETLDNRGNCKDE
jgi:hypothetical protein